MGEAVSVTEGLSGSVWGLFLKTPLLLCLLSKETLNLFECPGDSHVQLFDSLLHFSYSLLCWFNLHLCVELGQVLCPSRDVAQRANWVYWVYLCVSLETLPTGPTGSLAGASITPPQLYTYRRFVLCPHTQLSLALCRLWGKSIAYTHAFIDNECRSKSIGHVDHHH